jgi:hypothetical protein
VAIAKSDPTSNRNPTTIGVLSVHDSSVSVGVSAINAFLGCARVSACRSHRTSLHFTSLNIERSLNTRFLLWLFLFSSSTPHRISTTRLLAPYTITLFSSFVSHWSTRLLEGNMSAHRIPHQYYFDTETFIDIIHELERIPERLPSRNDSTANSNVTSASLERWQKLFGLTASEVQTVITEMRAIDIEQTLKDTSAETLQKWP